MYGLYEVCKTTCSDIWKYDTSYFMHFLWHYTVSYFVSWFFIGASRCARQIWWLEMLHVHVSGTGVQFRNKIFNVLNLCIPLIVLSFCVSYRLQLFTAKIRVWMRIPSVRQLLLMFQENGYYLSLMSTEIQCKVCVINVHSNA